METAVNLFFCSDSHLYNFQYADQFWNLDFSHRSPGEEDDEAHISHLAPEIRDVFGDSDDEEPTEYAVENHVEHDSNVRIVFFFLNFIYGAAHVVLQ